ncbi:Nacht and ankyrin domain protein [Mycena venus]|uniref:Nacht and ankyrin domain protein n=1 Tax=Mycena venus TaxID=2733690 RepID=A0A8H6XD85_9AGAR|nr:Nacht and ankyrin domain protein [Mycena venus]
MDLSSPSVSTPENSSDPSFATFDRALEEYIAGLPKDKKHFKFIELCRDTGAGVTPKAINDLIQREEARRTLSGPVRKIFNRVMSALKDYGEVISQLVSAQPLPCAIIWGALKIVVESSDRCDSMFESMKEELLALAEYLQRITVYEDLYGDSKEMQRLFFKSYTNIIRFWHRVHKECRRKVIATVGRSMTSSALKKMNSIISDIQSVSDSISEQASLCQGQKDKQEYLEARSERKLQSDWREKQSALNYLDLCKQIRDHLAPPEDVVRPNSQRHESNLRYIQSETCQWLIQEGCYTTWWGPRSKACRLFCLSGPPGYGKSVLTSFAIRDLESRGAAVAYYFCQFSQPCDDPTEILRLLSLQLFNVYFSRRLPLDQEMAHHILQSRSPDHVEDLVRELVINLLPNAGVYFFIDGLDEAMSTGISHVLVFLNNLRKEMATEKVGLWVSKRRQARVVECFEKHIQPEPGLTLELTDHTQADVVCFLRAKLLALKQRFFPQKDDLDETNKTLFRLAEVYLIVRAQGNFLWARLMTQDFDGENRVEDVKELLNRMILGDQPRELVDLYKGYFERFRRLDRDNQRIAIKVMSLITFARRQLRLEELQEAAAMLASHGKKKKAASDASRSISAMPLKTFLARYTTLVEVNGDPSEPSPSDTCRLVHSSVLEFLDQNPATLDKDSKDHQLQIGRFAIANACLIYLSRSVYAHLLIKQRLPDGTYTWVDTDGVTVDRHVFAQYAAKYWVRHLEDLEKKEQDQIRPRVENFVSSNNFHTCMQIQSIWVQGRFDVYYVSGQRSLLRAIPEWLIRSRPSDTGSKRLGVTKYWSDYRELMYDWRTLLSCGACHDSNPDCSYLTFRGESDRIWWTALGPDHLFSDFQGRHISFRLSQGNDLYSERFETLSVSKRHIVVVRLENWNRADGSLRFVCEHWSLSDPVSAPTLQKKQVIVTSEADTNWLLYAKPLSGGLRRLVARPTAFSSNAQILRLGAQLFRRDEDNEYRIVSGGGHAQYFEEASGRGALVVIGSRSHTLASQLQEPYRLFERFGEDFTRLEQSANICALKEEDSDTDVCDESASESQWLSETSSDMEMEGYESWSEGSTVDEGDIASNDTTSDSDGSPSETGSESDPEEASTSSSSSDESGSESASGKATPSELSRSAFPSLDESEALDSDDEEGLWGMEVDARLGALSHGRPLGRDGNTREPTVLLTALHYNDEATPTKLFEYSCPLRFMLYDSPPAVHPQEPLIVWALGGGDLLFADVVAKRYFTRQLRPSTSHSRQISVKLQFSSCGRFLHVASLEVRVSDTAAEADQRCENRRCPIHRPLPELHIFLLVLTYRLSTSKPTRSPPVLQHRVKVDLGKHEGPLNVSQLPFVFTWTPRDLFVTRRATNLEVFRIPLSGKPTSGPHSPEQSILVPMKKTVLPDSAALRDVYFVPLSDDLDGAYMVVVGGRNTGESCSGGGPDSTRTSR